MEKDELDEAWAYHVISSFDSLICTAKWGPVFYKELSDDAKTILYNMWVLRSVGKELIWNPAKENENV